jgi:diacylglycerol kinase family enzyme
MVCPMVPSGKWIRVGREPSCGATHCDGTMLAPLPVLINRRGGTAAALGDRLEDTVRAAFQPTGREIALELLDGSQLEEALRRRHAKTSIVAVGGGDGTLGAAAQALAGSRTALAILPLGTRNHLARALGVPLDLGEAAAVAATGERRRMDLGRAGKHVFVNNASIGLYPELLRERDRRELPKWLGTIPAAWEVLRKMRPRHYTLTIDGRARSVRTPLLFVGNNRYSLDFASLGERESLRDGELSLCAVRAEGPLQLIAFAVKVLLGLASPEADFDELAEAQSITIEGMGQIGLALDGEVMRMNLPLQLDMLPAALGIVTPRVPAGREPLFSRTH